MGTPVDAYTTPTQLNMSTYIFGFKTDGFSETFKTLQDATTDSLGDSVRSIDWGLQDEFSANLLASVKNRNFLEALRNATYNGEASSVFTSTILWINESTGSAYLRVQYDNCTLIAMTGKVGDTNGFDITVKGDLVPQVIT